MSTVVAVRPQFTSNRLKTHSRHALHLLGICRNVRWRAAQCVLHLSGLALFVVVVVAVAVVAVYPPPDSASTRPHVLSRVYPSTITDITDCFCSSLLYLSLSTLLILSSHSVHQHSTSSSVRAVQGTASRAKISLPWPIKGSALAVSRSPEYISGMICVSWHSLVSILNALSRS
ncbi:hypothetical protein BZA70DRAFT_182835 [Myxozyma melibiosi]|uniref:Uncharacterized protein n=1 Tax=Myxozyma melibiosi TaxID=54550 RepID=A0ABR1F4K4_9ASCO